MKKIILLISMLALCGCSVTITSKDVGAAEKACINNNGLRYIESNLTLTMGEVVCNNGATFKIYTRPYHEDLGAETNK